MKNSVIFKRWVLGLFCLMVLAVSLSAASLSGTLKKYGLMHLNEWIMYYPYDHLGVNVFSGTNPEGGAFFHDKTCVLAYSDGLVWAGLVRDGREPALQAGGAYYRSGTQPGWIVSPGKNGQAPQPIPLDNNRLRMYRWRKDFFQVSDEELRREVALLLTIPEDSVNQAQIDTLRQQYWQDLQNWPVDLGAPYYDRNENGQYDPDYDEPGFLGADQLLWYVVNDMNSARTKALFGSMPMGLEIQTTVWSYKIGLGLVVFRRYLLINKSEFAIDSMFVGQLVDCDVGDYSDDRVGCDSTWGYGFAYNDSDFDAVFTSLNLVPPAFAVVLLQGPIVEKPGATAIQNLEVIPEHQNLPMTSFWYQATGDEFSGPNLGSYYGTLQLWGNLQGYADYYGGQLRPFLTYIGNQWILLSPWPFAGNPVTHEGQIDGVGGYLFPGSREFMVNSGPFSMQPGQSQEIIYAYVAAYSASNHLDAVAKLQKLVPTVKQAYQEFLRFQPPVGPRQTKQPAKTDSTGVDYFLLAEGYPNPFKQNVKIKFRLLNQMDIRLDVFNSAGQRVKTLYWGIMNKGVHDLQWDGTNQVGNRLPSGIYFVRLKHGPLMRWKKIIMLK